MKPSNVITTLHHLLDINRPVFIWGPPGAGKSDVVAQVAAERKLELRDVRLSLLDPVDMKGFPTPDLAKNVMRWLPADFLPTKGKGILFLDEMNSAPQSVQAAAYQLVLTGQIGEYKMPAGWRIIAAGNRAGDRSVVHAMPAALANRFYHIDFDINVEDWCLWANKNGIHSDVVAFIRFRQNLLHSYDATQNPRAFASPRTWKFLNDSYASQSKLPKGLALDVYKGVVGDGPASEFISFVDVISQLPSIDEIALAPTTAKLPNSPSAKYAISTSLARATSMKNFDAFMKYVERLDTEFQVLYMTDTLARDTSVAKTAAFTTWSRKNSDVVL